MAAPDPTVAATPPEPAPGGRIFLPAHALHLEGERVYCNGLWFVRVDGETWSMLESLRVRDQELDDWVGRERIFAVAQYEGVAATAQEAIFAPALAAYSALVAGARLIASGTWIDATHLAPVARGADGFNLRLTGVARPRLWAAVFGEPQAVRGRRREWQDRVECRPFQYHLPHGPGYILNADRARDIEVNIAALQQLRELAPHHEWWAAHRAFQRGHDLFVPRRLRLTSLFSAFETLFGPFHRRTGDPGVGAAVAAALESVGAAVPGATIYVEKTMRQARNRLAHGSDVAVPLDWGAVEGSVLGLLRAGLNVSLEWIRGRRGPESALAPGGERSLIAFQRTLGRVVPDED